MKDIVQPALAKGLRVQMQAVVVTKQRKNGDRRPQSKQIHGLKHQTRSFDENIESLPLGIQQIEAYD